MTLDQKIQIWNAVGTWVAGIATFLAVLVSLYLARRSEAVKIKADVGIRLVFAGDGTPAEEHVGFSAVNLGDRPMNIVSIGWSIGKRKGKRFCVQPVAGQYSHQYPKQLTHGEQASFMVSFKTSPNWPKEFAEGFVKDMSEKNLKTLRALINISLGKVIEVVPENNLLEKLRKANAS